MQGINRFRHISWLYSNLLYTHGGFESSRPSVPTDLLTCVDLSEAFSTNMELLRNVELPTNAGMLPNAAAPRANLLNQPPGERPNNNYQLNKKFVMVEIRNEKGVYNEIQLEQLTVEAQKMVDYNQ